jgi:hypothetical protein
MLWSWHLSFRLDEASPEIGAVVSAVEGAIGQPLTLSCDRLAGNPHDGYYAWSRGETTVNSGSESVDVRGQLSFVSTQFADGPMSVDTAWVQFSLYGKAPLALDRVRGQLATGLGQLGYEDETWAWSTASIVDALEAAGQTARVQVLRKRITEALITRTLREPPHRGVTISFARPDDIDRVLRAAPQPAVVRSVSLCGCALEALPTALVDGPVLFEALENLNLAYNRLTSLPPLLERYSNLKWLRVNANPMPRPKRGAWPGVKIVFGK